MRAAIRVGLVGLALLPGLGAARTAGPPPVAVSAPDGGVVQWSSLVRRHGPVAVLLWSSWAPGGRTVLASCGKLAGAAESRGLSFLIVDVQEPMEAARGALVGAGLAWVHDRYGRLLRRYRVFHIPTLLILGRDGAVLARLDPTPRALEDWK